MSERKPKPEDIAAYALSDEMLQGRIPSSEIGRAAKSLAFLRTAIHGDSPDADAIREALGLRFERRNELDAHGGMVEVMGEVRMVSRPPTVKRRVVSEWRDE